MLDELMRRSDVKRLLNLICNSSRYSDKKKDDSINYNLFVDTEQILFVFYDALFKYKIIIEDMFYFDDYIEQLDKLFKKIDNIASINEGINRLIGRSCLKKLGIKDSTDFKKRELVLNHIYDKYIVNGYYIHGYSDCYSNNIKTNGFIPGSYENYEDDFKKIQHILDKRASSDIIDKNFDLKSTFFTDSMMMGCFYSINSPMYFYKLLCKNNCVSKNNELDAYFRNDYDQCLKNINKLCFKLDLNKNDKSVIVDTYKKEWKLLNREKSSISMILVPRKYFNINNNIDMKEFNSNSSYDSLGEAISKLLGSRNNNIVCTKPIDLDNITFVTLPSYSQLNEDCCSKKVEEIEENVIDDFAFSNAYGKVSVLLLMGTILVSLGVLLSIVMLGGI